jgi:type II secretory pathway component PulC
MFHLLGKFAAVAPAVIAARLALALAAVLLIAAVAETIPRATPPVVIARVPDATATPPAAPDYHAIAAAHLFGIHDPAAPAEPVVSAAAAVADETPDVAVETTLNLRLSGVVHTAGGGARAVIAGDSLVREATFAAGDQVMEGVEVVAIERFRVLIRNRGRLEALLLPGAEEGDSGASARHAPAKVATATGIAAAAITD